MTSGRPQPILGLFEESFMRRTLSGIAGVVLLAFGALFLLQGMGVIRWPADSFMIDNRVWITRGAILALVGAGLIVLSRIGRIRA
jgi:hypothetical protein